MDYERSYYLISHIFERVARRINKQVPSAETSETTEHKYCTSYHLHHVGIEITGEAMPSVRESKTSAMLKVLEFAENNCNFTIQDVTAQLLKSMTDKIESAPAESSLFKHRGHIINNYIQTTHNNLNASIDAVVAAAEVPPEENDPSSIVAYYREQLNTVKASFDASYAELAEIEVTPKCPT